MLSRSYTWAVLSAFAERFFYSSFPANCCALQMYCPFKSARKWHRFSPFYSQFTALVRVDCNPFPLVLALLYSLLFSSTRVNKARLNFSVIFTHATVIYSLLAALKIKPSLLRRSLAFLAVSQKEKHFLRLRWVIRYVVLFYCSSEGPEVCDETLRI